MILSSVDLPEPFGPEHADLGVGVEGQVDVLEDLLAAGIGLGQALHVIDELARHSALRLAPSGPSNEIDGEVGAYVVEGRRDCNPAFRARAKTKGGTALGWRGAADFASIPTPIW